MKAKVEVFPPDRALLAERFKALAHPARLAILDVLARQTTCLCGEVVDAVPLSQATVSRHLKILKEAGLIRGTVDGPRSCYCIEPVVLRQLKAGIDAVFDVWCLAEDHTDRCAGGSC